MGRVLKSDKKSAQTRDRVRRYRALKKAQNQHQQGLNRSDNISQNNNNETVYPAEIKLRMWALKHNITRNALCD